MRRQSGRLIELQLLVGAAFMFVVIFVAQMAGDQGLGHALLVTHWPVETRSARLLVTQTIERYANAPGTSRAEALRQASLAVMQANADASGKALFSSAHPVFWAPYALVGDGGR